MEVDDTRPGFDSSESELASDETSQSHTASDELASDESAEEIASDESGAENPSSQRGAKEAPFPSQVGRPSAIKTSAARRSATGALQPKLRVASPRRSILVASSGQVYTPSLLSAQRGPYRGVKDGLQQSVQPLGTNQQEASVDQSCAAIATSPASSDSDDCDITAAAARAIAAGGNPQYPVPLATAAEHHDVETAGSEASDEPSRYFVTPPLRPLNKLYNSDGSRCSNSVGGEASQAAAPQAAGPVPVPAPIAAAPEFTDSDSSGFGTLENFAPDQVYEKGSRAALGSDQHRAVSPAAVRVDLRLPLPAPHEDYAYQASGRSMSLAHSLHKVGTVSAPRPKSMKLARGVCVSIVSPGRLPAPQALAAMPADAHKDNDLSPSGIAQRISSTAAGDTPLEISAPSTPARKQRQRLEISSPKPRFTWLSTLDEALAASDKATRSMSMRDRASGADQAARSAALQAEAGRAAADRDSMLQFLQHEQEVVEPLRVLCSKLAQDAIQEACIRYGEAVGASSALNSSRSGAHAQALQSRGDAVETIYHGDVAALGSIRRIKSLRTVSDPVPKDNSIAAPRARAHLPESYAATRRRLGLRPEVQTSVASIPPTGGSLPHKNDLLIDYESTVVARASTTVGLRGPVAPEEHPELDAGRWHEEDAMHSHWQNGTRYDTSIRSSHPSTTSAIGPGTQAPETVIARSMPATPIQAVAQVESPARHPTYEAQASTTARASDLERSIPSERPGVRRPPPKRDRGSSARLQRLHASVSAQHRLGLRRLRQAQHRGDRRDTSSRSGARSTGHAATSYNYSRSLIASAISPCIDTLERRSGAAARLSPSMTARSVGAARHPDEEQMGEPLRLGDLFDAATLTDSRAASQAPFVSAARRAGDLAAGALAGLVLGGRRTQRV